MNRSSFAQPMLVLAAVMTLVVGLATIASPSTAEAQDATAATLTMQVSSLENDQAFRTVAVALDPGQTGLAALGAALTFDTDVVHVTSCAVSEVGACNVLDDGRVLVSVFNLSSLRANDRLLTINFEDVPGSTGPTTFELMVTTAVAASGDKIADITGDTIDIAIADEPADTQVQVADDMRGSLTGTIIAQDTATALYAIDVCVIHDLTGVEACTPSTGLGNWRIDDLATGTHTVTASDATGVYTAMTGTGTVIGDQVALVDDLALTYVVDEIETTDDEQDEAEKDAAEQDAAEQEEVPATEPLPTPETLPTIVPDTAVVVVYKASIMGSVRGLESEAPLQAAQVCATQPLVLHQSCATTDADGRYALAGLSTGNYLVEVVDPLGQFEQIRPTLVGVVSDEATRTGVDIIMRTIGD